jgi:hypothetical protein
VSDDPSLVAARERVAVVLERLTHVELGTLVVGPPDDTRRAARDRARDAAIVAGRAALLAEASEAARTSAMRTFARAGFTGTWAATEMAASVARPEDRLAAAAAFEEAATAAVAEDLVDNDTTAILRAATVELVAAGSMPQPGSLSALTASAGGAGSGAAGAVLVAAVVVACVLGAIVTGSVVGAIAGAFVVAAVAWLARWIARPVA